VASRAIDLAVASLLLLLAAPLMAGIALAIRLEGPGPVVFRDTRVGRYRRPFTMYKFRTLRWNHPATVRGGDRASGSPQAAHDYQKPRRHPALTRVGSWLREWSLDELPNLVNVLRGEMAVVGPRPTGWSGDSFGDACDEILAVKPGVTGLWQVMGRGDLPFARRVALDLEYVRTRSLALDLWIVLQTVPAVLLRRGAY
jgi:lipopolysaccharide/colanic/teichoic acid biosynthesis glycosyltransferase